MYMKCLCALHAPFGNTGVMLRYLKKKIRLAAVRIREKYTKHTHPPATLYT